MARVCLTEPSETGGIGASGVRILEYALVRAGHTVTRVHVHRRGSSQLPLLDGGTVELTGRSTQRPDAWFVSALYPRQWLDVPRLLARIGVPALAEHRAASDPLVAFGGQSAIAPAPLEPFADVIALGDGERTGPELAEWCARGREYALARADESPGYMVPSRTRQLTRVESGANLIGELLPGRPMVEIARGCKSKCAFCPIGWAGGSYREASEARVMASIDRVRGKKLLLYAPDGSSVDGIARYEQRLHQAGCGNAARDARLDRLMRHAVATARSYSFGIEGLSARLRAAIGKPIADEDIVAAHGTLARVGVKSVRWYMIIGLPGEDDADLREFLELLDAAHAVFPRSLSVTLTHFQAVPHTPLGRLANRYDERAVARGLAIREHLRRAWEASERKTLASQPKGRELHESDVALQRGPREVAHALIELGGNRAAFGDGRWRETFARHGADPERALDAHPDATPWDHVVTGAKPEKLRAALARYWHEVSGAPS